MVSAVQAEDSCAILPRSQHGIRSAQAAAERGVATALRQHGVVVIAAADTELRLAGRSEATCGEIACADDINRLLGTSFAVLVEVLGTGNRAQMVNVALITNREGSSVGGQAAIERGVSVEQAAEQATHQALDRYAADIQGYLVIDSVPSGATVAIDGVAVGETPLRRLVANGTHRVSVSMSGRVTASEEVTVDPHSEHEMMLTLLDADAAAAVVTPPPSHDVVMSSGPDVGLLVTGGALIILGLVLFAVLPLPTLLQNGQCTDATCSTWHRFGEVSWALSAVSLTSIVTGVVLGIVGLQTHSRTVQEQSSLFRFQGL